MLGGAAEKCHPDIVKTAPGQNIHCTGVLSEIKTKIRKLEIQGLGETIPDRNKQTNTNNRTLFSVRSQHFPQGMKIPTCSALYRKIFARTGMAAERPRSRAGSGKDCLSLQCLQMSLPSQAAVGPNSAVLMHNFTFKCFNEWRCTAELGDLALQWFAFLLFKYF